MPPPESSFISKPVLNMAQSSTRRGSGRRPTLPTDPAIAVQEGVATALTVIGQKFTQVMAAQTLKENNLRDRTFVSATGVMQKRLDLELKRELTRFYTTDGRDIEPPSDYSQEIGFGIILNQADFYDEENGSRKTFSDVVKSVHDRFADSRRDSAPSLQAEKLASDRLSYGHLQATIGAYAFQDKRQPLVLANNLNTVVRSYKDAIHDEKGFSPLTFATHLDSLNEVYSASNGLVDPGAANNARIQAMGDMLSIGITDAYYNQDNAVPLSILAAGKLADTFKVRQIVSGLPEKDLAYLQGARESVKVDVSKRTFAKGANVPKDKSDYMYWAYAQMPLEVQADLQARSLEAFKAQTDQKKETLISKVNGMYTAASSPMVRDAGFRATIERNTPQLLAEVARVFPRSLFPKENAELFTKVLVGSKSAEIRGDFDEVPTPMLGAFARDRANALASQIMQEVPSSLYFSTLPVQRVAREALTKFADTETKRRREAPFESMMLASKDIKELYKSLVADDFITHADKAKNQRLLRDRILDVSSKLAIEPAFLSKHDANVLKSFSDSGQTAELAQVVDDVRDRYGEQVFFDYVLPQIAKDRKGGGLDIAYALIPDKSISQIVLDSTINSEANKKLAREREIQGIENLESRITDNVYGWYAFWEGEEPMEAIYGYIDDKMTGSDAANAKIAMQRAIRDVALQKVLSENLSIDDALGRAKRMIADGIGTTMNVLGKTRIVPPNVTLNEPRFELLDEVLRNDTFLRDTVYNKISPNPYAVNQAQVLKKPIMEVYDSWFKDENILNWKFAHQGLVPVVEHELYPELSFAIPGDDGGAFVIPYEELPIIISQPKFFE